MWEMIGRHAVVFGVVGALDFVWAFYTFAMLKHRPTAAGVWAALLIAFNGAAWIGVTNDPWTLPAGMAGAFVGTSFSVWLDARRARASL